MSLTISELPPPPPRRTGWPWTSSPSTLPSSPPGSDTWPRISIVTPSYNQGRYLEETIRSVLLQGYPDLEYFVIDGGSTDGSVEIIERYDRWITHWESGPDRGQSDAIRKGFDRSTGEMLAWLNSDDRYRPTVLFTVAREYQRHSEPGLIYARSAVCDEAGASLVTTVGHEFSLGETVRGDNCVAQPSAFFSRAVYDAVGGIDESLHYVMDMDLWLRIGLQSRVVFVDDVWTDFRHHPASKTCRDALEFDREIYQIVERAFESLPLPKRLQSSRRSVLAELLMRLAFRHYQAADNRRARRRALDAVLHDPKILRSDDNGGVFLKCLLGRKAVTRMKKIVNRPTHG